MPVMLHVLADDSAIEDVEDGEQRRRSVALVVVGHGARASGRAEHLSDAMDFWDKGNSASLRTEPRGGAAYASRI